MKKKRIRELFRIICCDIILLEFAIAGSYNFHVQETYTIGEINYGNICQIILMEI